MDNDVTKQTNNASFDARLAVLEVRMTLAEKRLNGVENKVMWLIGMNFAALCGIIAQLLGVHR